MNLGTQTGSVINHLHSRAVIGQPEQAAKTWARENGHKVVSDIVSQGEYRAWVEPKRSAA